MIDSVVDALRHVIDPELDESIVELGFVDSVNVRGDAVEVVLRLPTFWCAPNFAWLMAADARDAIRALPGIQSVQVTLRDNAYSDEISTGVSCDHTFSATFAGQTEGEDLEDLRRVFWRKASACARSSWCASSRTSASAPPRSSRSNPARLCRAALHRCCAHISIDANGWASRACGWSPMTRVSASRRRSSTATCGERASSV